MTNVALMVIGAYQVLSRLCFPVAAGLRLRVPSTPARP